MRDIEKHSEAKQRKFIIYHIYYHAKDKIAVPGRNNFGSTWMNMGWGSNKGILMNAGKNWNNGTWANNGLQNIRTAFLGPTWVNIHWQAFGTTFFWVMDISGYNIFKRINTSLAEVFSHLRQYYRWRLRGETTGINTQILLIQFILYFEFLLR